MHFARDICVLRPSVLTECPFFVKTFFFPQSLGGTFSADRKKTKVKKSENKNKNKENILCSMKTDLPFLRLPRPLRQNLPRACPIFKIFVTSCLSKHTSRSGKLNAFLCLSKGPKR